MSEDGTERLPPGRLTKDELYDEVVDRAGLPEKNDTGSSPFKKEHLVELVRYLRAESKQ